MNRDPLQTLDSIFKRVCNKKLSGLEPGLIKIQYSFENYPQQELAMIMTSPLADHLELANNALCYRPFLRSSMKAVPSGFKPCGPFSGLEILDEHIQSVDGRVIQLSPGYADFKNYKGALIGCNNPLYHEAKMEILVRLQSAGFDALSSSWDDYKLWEERTMETFK